MSSYNVSRRVSLALAFGFVPKTNRLLRLVFYRCLTFFIDIANLGMCTIALPTIKDELDFDEGTLQWVMTAYSLTVILSQLWPPRAV